MPFPFTTAFAAFTSLSWPLPGVLAIVLLAMAVCASLGVRDLLAALRPPTVEGEDRRDT